MLREVYSEFPDLDGNFVEQFQTSGFDPRTFELFLSAMFKDLGHHIEPRTGEGSPVRGAPLKGEVLSENEPVPSEALC